MLKYQIEEKKQKGEEAYQEYLKEKGQVNQIVEKIIQEDLRYDIKRKKIELIIYQSNRRR